MQALNATGEFWLPGPNGIKRHGRLIFDPLEGATLTLWDALAERIGDGESVQMEGGFRDSIFGVIEVGELRQEVTLLDVMYVNRKKYRPNTLLVGGHFDGPDKASFDSMIVCLQDAAPWINRDALSVEVDFVSMGAIGTE